MNKESRIRSGRIGKRNITITAMGEEKTYPVNIYKDPKYLLVRNTHVIGSRSFFRMYFYRRWI